MGAAVRRGTRPFSSEGWRINSRIRVALLLILGVVAVWFVWRVRRLFMPLALAGVISYLFLPLVSRLERRQVPRSVAILLVYAGGAVVVGTAVTLVLPVFVSEVDALLTELPEQTAKVEQLALGFLKRLRERSAVPAGIREAVEAILLQIEYSLARFATRLINLILALFTQVFYLILAPVIAYFIMRDWETIRQGIVVFFPARYRADLLTLGGKINEVLSGFIRGQLLVAFVIGIIIAAGLAVLGVRYALVLGLIAGAFEVIPYFGPVIGAVPAVLLAMLESPSTALWTVGLFVAANQLEAMVLAPRIVGDFVGIHPLAVICAILAGAEIGGMIGMLVAVPVTAVLKVVGQFVLNRLVDGQ